MRGDTLLTRLGCLCSCIAKPEFQREKKGGIFLTESQIYGCFSAERQRAPQSQGIAGMPREEGSLFHSEVQFVCHTSEKKRLQG
jgi:hypothetical protein